MAWPGSGDIDTTKFDNDADKISLSRPELYKMAGYVNDMIDVGDPSGNYVTLDTTQTITGNKTFSGTVTLNEFAETVYAGGTLSTYTPDWDNGSVHAITLNGDLTLNAPSNMPTGGTISIIITQSNRTMTANSAYRFAGGENTLSPGINAIDVLHIFYDGTNYLTTMVKGYV